ncbi:TIGR04255 family protein [Pelomonas sp. KK5]|uniref:TIGR04255 family protein n=1 Tax=Pelomonas sp. KK5 TaxID=1855730 RepID=UPI00097C94C7|nr:TIGR04255 family protein [Pelomonas sp. KK5]
MSQTLQNAPLLELIAEVKWVPPWVPQAMVAGVPRMVPQNLQEFSAFVDAFSRSVASLEYTEQLRLYPQELPALLHQPLIRANNAKATIGPSLYQAGLGVFSANATPPYKNWEMFSPVVRSGLEALVSARNAVTDVAPVASITLRYLDAFTAYHLHGLESTAFIKELGFELQAPKISLDYMAKDGACKPYSQFHIPLTDGGLLAMSVGDGIANGTPAVLLDTAVTFFPNAEVSTDQIMESFVRAHEIIDDIFRVMIKPIAHLMRAEGEK